MRVAAAALATGGLLLPALAEAHGGATDPGLGPSPGLLGLGVAGILAAAPWAWRLRRSGALALVATLLLFLAEGGVHGVHHLLDRADASHCQVLTVSQHLSCDVAAAGRPVVRVDTWQPLVAPSAVSRVYSPAIRPDRGRAPPSLTR